mgnify:CR=1 FL=1
MQVHHAFAIEYFQVHEEVLFLQRLVAKGQMALEAESNHLVKLLDDLFEQQEGFRLVKILFVNVCRIELG